MKHWDNLIFSGQHHKTEMGNTIIFFNINDNKVSDCEVVAGDTIMYMNEKYKVITIERFVKTFNGTDGNPLLGDNFAFLVKKLSEIMEEETKKLVEKWDATGLLKGLKPMTDLDKGFNMTKLLESVPREKIERMPNE